MMKRVTRILAALALLLGGIQQAKAGPLTLDYSVSPTGTGLFQYQFTLLLDNHDGSWKPGQGFDWLVFGDEQSKPSPIADFQMTSPFPVGPWTGLTSSAGGHNGPTFEPVIGALWTPTAVGDSLSWSGTSKTELGQGQLLFSTLINSPGAVGANFDVATEINAPAVPEPASLTLLATGAVALLGYGWRRRR